MKTILVISLLIICSFNISAQAFKTGDKVQVDLLMSSSREGTWQDATVTNFDPASNMYTVRLSNGNEMGIPSRKPEKWIKPALRKQPVETKTDDDDPQTANSIIYEERDDILYAPDCKSSEAYIKKKIKAQLAKDYYGDYPHIAVDFISFKAQHGYPDKRYPNQTVYPFKIEMLVHIKRNLTQGGKEYTEYRTWKFDRVYEYATRPGSDCEFYPVPSSDAKLISSKTF